MSKRILVTSTDLMMVQFLLPHIRNLCENGYKVEIACSEVGGRLDEVRERISGCVEEIHVVRLHRSPVTPDNFNGYKDMKKIISEGHYDIIWTNEPVMGVVTRLAAKQARKQGTKVLYMVHGFHFYDGAPKLNWMIYYPIEKLMASKADMIATISRGDYQYAKKMHAERCAYIHGIGINTERLQPAENRWNLRKELHLQDDDFIVLSVGELNKNKNQKVIIEAISRLKNSEIHYIICGKGDQYANLQSRVSQLHMDSQVHFLGYRKDVVDICSQVDLFAMPSHREGLGLAALEAMYCGLPVVASNTRGLEDIVIDGLTGYLCQADDIEAFAEAILKVMENRNFKSRASEKIHEIIQPYCIEQSKNEILKLIKSLE